MKIANLRTKRPSELMFESVWDSKDVEDLFNHARDRERSSKPGKLEAKGVWACVQTSTISDECDRPPAPKR